MQQIIAAHPGLPAQRIDGVAAERSRKVMGRGGICWFGLGCTHESLASPCPLACRSRMRLPSPPLSRLPAARPPSRPPGRRAEDRLSLRPSPGSAAEEAAENIAQTAPRPACPRSAAPHRRGPLKAL